MAVTRANVTLRPVCDSDQAPEEISAILQSFRRNRPKRVYMKGVPGAAVCACGRLHACVSRVRGSVCACGNVLGIAMGGGLAIVSRYTQAELRRQPWIINPSARARTCGFEWTSSEGGES